MDRKNFYFGQKVTESELDAAFDDVEDAFKKFIAGFDYVGIAAGAEITEHSPTNFTVDANGPAIIYDQNQERIGWSPVQNVDLSLDELGAATVVTGAPNSRWLTIFAEFVRDETDARIDGFNKAIFFQKNESFKINVAQGGEAPSPIRPALRGGQILLADVLIVFGQTTILDADVNLDRTEYIYRLTGTPNVINERGLQNALQEMLDIINGFDVSTIVAPQVVDAPFSLAAGSVASQLAALLALNNDEPALRRHPSGFEEGALPVRFDADDLYTPMWQTDKLPADHPGYPLSYFKLLWQVAAGPTGAQYIRCYSGASNQAGTVLTRAPQLMFTVNAVWLGDALNAWVADDTGQPAQMVGYGPNFTEPGGSSNWFLGKDDTSGIWDHFSGWDDNLGGQGDLIISGDYTWYGVRERKMRINPMSAQVGQQNSGANPGVAQWIPDLGFGSMKTANSQASQVISEAKIVFPIVLPHGSKLTKVEIIYQSGKAGNVSNFYLRKTGGTDFAASNPSSETYSVLDSVTGHLEANDGDVSTITLTADEMVNSATEFFQLYVFTNGTLTEIDWIHSIRVTFDDAPGPVNH